MACYSLTCTVVSRGKEQSIARLAAYNNRARLTDFRLKETYNYSSRADLLTSGILLPEDAPDRLNDLQQLITELDAAERRKDAQLAQNFKLALPLELSLEEQVGLIEQYCYQNFVSKGYSVSWAIHSGEHNPSGIPDEIVPVKERKDNPHAHVLVPFRKVDSQGFCRTKMDSRTRNPSQQLIEWRKSWADIQNQAFERLGLPVRVSHLSLQAQGIDRQPTIHLGPETIALERKGIKTNRGDRYLSALSKSRDHLGRKKPTQEQERRPFFPDRNMRVPKREDQTHFSEVERESQVRDHSRSR